MSCRQRPASSVSQTPSTHRFAVCQQRQIRAHLKFTHLDVARHQEQVKESHGQGYEITGESWSPRRIIMGCTKLAASQHQQQTLAVLLGISKFTNYVTCTTSPAPNKKIKWRPKQDLVQGDQMKSLKKWLQMSIRDDMNEKEPKNFQKCQFTQ